MSLQRQLRQQIARNFDPEELNTLCFDLDLPYNELPGTRLNSKVNALLVAVYQIGKLPFFHQILVEERPEITWPKLEQIQAINWEQLAENITFSPTMLQRIFQLRTVGSSNLVAQGNDNALLAQQAVNVGGNLGEKAQIQTGGTYYQNCTIIHYSKGTYIEAIEKEQILPAVSHDKALKRYLNRIINNNRLLRLQGIQSVKTGQPVHIELEKIYVTLRTITETQTGKYNVDQLLQLEQDFSIGDRERISRLDQIKGTETINVNRVLKENRRLAIIGDPGSGKTTLLSYLALIYARDFGEASGLVQKAFSDSEISFKEGNMLPVFLELRKLATYIADQPSYFDGPAQLLALYRHHLDSEGVKLNEGFFKSYLESGEAIVLLDGLDEVADNQLKQRITQLIERFTTTYPNCRYVVSSRIAGYTGLGANYHVATIREFRLADIHQFLLNWYQIITVNKYGPGRHALQHAKERTLNLVSAIQENSAIQDLAINPLLLTVIALVHKDLEITSLPSQRAELYEKAIDVLIYTWEEAKVGIQAPTIGDRHMTAVQKRLILQTIALQMQEERIREIDLAKLQEIVRGELRQLYQDMADVSSIEREFTKLLEERAGILVARSRGVYGFSHLTFQEYLAGCAIANQNNYIKYTLERVADSWWRETILLEAGYLSLHGREKVSQLVQAIADHSDEPSQYHNTVLALECINDVGEGGIEAKVKVDVQDRLQKAINLPLEGKTDSTLAEAINIRGLAVSALQQAGMGYWSGPYGEPEWITIPAGSFQMGGNRKHEAQPIHSVDLPKFQIARVPITNAQYLIFVNDTQQEPPEHWEEGKIPAGLESRPVVNVSWHDAICYCDWLAKNTGKRVTLPSEAEWEKAAGWDAEKQQKRVFPWGDRFIQYYSNCRELKVMDSTPVGIFEEGSSPYGVLDMSGNVQEWTRSHYKDYPYHPNDGREDLKADNDVRRVVRSGSFALNLLIQSRVANRSTCPPNNRFFSLGFRVVLLSSKPSAKQASLG